MQSAGFAIDSVSLEYYDSNPLCRTHSDGICVVPENREKPIVLEDCDDFNGVDVKIGSGEDTRTSWNSLVFDSFLLTFFRI
eukprot:1380965-Amorphochlora_amoeboformis.AAC.1